MIYPGQPVGPADVMPLARDPEETPAPAPRRRPDVPTKPSELLGLPEWLQLLRLVGYWDDAVPMDEVWRRIDQWDAEQLESQETAQ